MTNIQIEITLATFILLILIFFNLRRNSMSVKSSIAWLLLPIILIIIAIFPDPLEQLAHSLGFEAFSNFIFVVIIALLLIICFFLTTTINRQDNQITKLIQEIALLKHDKSQKNKSNNDKKTKP